MRNMFCIYTLSCCLLLLTGGCKRENGPLTTPNAQVGFYNASYCLSLMISDAHGSHKAPLLLDNDDPDYTPPPQGAASQTLPSFDSRATSSLQFPNSGTNAGILQPWILYMRVSSGQHRLLLLDTNLVHRRILDTTVFNAVTDVPRTIYFSDSMGVFRSVITRDEQKLLQDSIRIRLVDLSPDAGMVTLVVNKTGHFFYSAAYGSVSTYVNYPLKDAARLTMQVRSSVDSTKVLARTILNASPGRSYTLLLQGYNNGGGSFTDPDGKPVTINANIGLTANTSF
ncbi:MAG: DUF4397 domain-containing protein [Chitinophagaceae bacterium]|nr:DUF4397 domain-containing protein [Chitinophagaceae bacterium]